MTVFPSLVQHILVLSVSDSYLPLCEARIVQGSSVGSLGFLFSLFPNRGKDRASIFVWASQERPTLSFFFFFSSSKTSFGAGSSSDVFLLSLGDCMLYITQCWAGLLYICARAVLCCTKCEIREQPIVNIDRLQCIAWEKKKKRWVSSWAEDSFVLKFLPV